MLDGRRSFHPLYRPLKDSAQVLWSQLGGPAVTLSNPTDLLTSFVAPPDAGLLTFELTITTSNGRTASQQVAVHVVSNSTHEAPVIAVDGDRNITVAEGFSLTAAVSSNALPAITWAQAAGAAITTTSQEDKLTGSASSAGVLVFGARATGATGLLSAPDYAIIVVADAGSTGQDKAPVATGSAAAKLSDITVAPNATVTLDMPTGASDSYAFVQLAGDPVVLDLTQAAIPTNAFVTFPAPNHLDTLTFAYYATNSNLRSVPELFTVTVADAALAGLSASAGPDRSSHPGTTVVLDGHLSVLGAAIPIWTQTLGPQVTFDAGTASTLAPSFAAPSESSELSFILQLQLPGGIYSTASTVVVRVRPVTLNDPPTISIAETTIGTPSDTFTALVIDPENDPIASLFWEVDSSSATKGDFTTPTEHVTMFKPLSPDRPIVVKLTACDSLLACHTQTMSFAQ